MQEFVHRFEPSPREQMRRNHECERDLRLGLVVEERSEGASNYDASQSVEHGSFARDASDQDELEQPPDYLGFKANRNRSEIQSEQIVKSSDVDELREGNMAPGSLSHRIKETKSFKSENDLPRQDQQERNADPVDQHEDAGELG